MSILDKKPNRLDPFLLMWLALFAVLLLPTYANWRKTRRDLDTLNNRVEFIERMQFKVLPSAYLTNSTSIFAFGHESLGSLTNASEVYYFGEQRTNAATKR